MEHYSCFPGLLNTVNLLHMFFLMYISGTQYKYGIILCMLVNDHLRFSATQSTMCLLPKQAFSVDLLAQFCTLLLILSFIGYVET